MNINLHIEPFWAGAFVATGVILVVWYVGGKALDHIGLGKN